MMYMFSVILLILAIICLVNMVVIYPVMVLRGMIPPSNTPYLVRYLLFLASPVVSIVLWIAAYGFSRPIVLPLESYFVFQLVVVFIAAASLATCLRTFWQTECTTFSTRNQYFGNEQVRPSS